MLPHAHIWISTIKRHFPPPVRNTPITINCNCQSVCTVTLLTVARCEVLPLCRSSPPSACVVPHLSDVGLIHYIGCFPQVARHTHTHAHTHTHSERERKRKREKGRERERKRLSERVSKTFSLFSAGSDPIYSVNMFFTS